nr:MAG: DNA pilot protein [Microvirus sp.]
MSSGSRPGNLKGWRLMPWWAPVAGAAVSGGLGFLGGASANDANRQIAENQMSFQARQNILQKDFIREQMAWQERMSGSAYQREMADLQKAGLNPMLAAVRGGASTPSGGGTPASAAGASARMESPVEKAVSSAAVGLNTALSAAKLMSEIRLVDAQAESAEDQALLSRANASHLQNYLFRGTDLENQRRELELKYYGKRQESELNLQSASAAEIQSRTLLNRLMVPEARNAAEAQDSAFMRNVAPFLNSVLRLRQIASPVGR